jgi:hypothetical protein
LKKLTALNLSNLTPLTPATLPYLAQLTTLEVLDVSNNNIFDTCANCNELVEHLAALVNLHTLNLSGSQVTVLQPLSSMVKLKTLNLAHCDALRAGALATVLQMPSLTSLDLTMVVGDNWMPNARHPADVQRLDDWILPHGSNLKRLILNFDVWTTNRRHDGPLLHDHQSDRSESLELRAGDRCRLRSIGRVDKPAEPGPGWVRHG